MVVGFVGLGNQGAPIAKKIAAAGWPLHVWARDAESLTSFAAAGATISASPMALGEACDLVGVCVTSDADVLEIVLRDGRGILYGMKRGGIIAVHATVAPETVISLAETARPHGVQILDAPVSGGPRGAEAGTMTVMAGGEADVLAKATPVLRTFASTIAHLGPLGAGQIMKLLNNNLAYANMALGVVALELAQKIGLDQASAAQVIKVSSGASTAFNGVVTDPTTLRKATGPTSNIPKDHAHFARLMQAKGILNDPLAELAATAFDRLSAYAKRS